MIRLEFISTIGRLLWFIQMTYLLLLPEVGSGVNHFQYVFSFTFFLYPLRYHYKHSFWIFCNGCHQVSQVALDQLVADKIESNGLNGFSLFWGGLVRIDLLKVFQTWTLMVILRGPNYVRNVVFQHVFIISGSSWDMFDILWTKGVEDSYGTHR